jgi:hypothetical protein
VTTRQRLLVGTLAFPLLRLRRAPAVFEAGHPAAFEVFSTTSRRQAGNRSAPHGANTLAPLALAGCLGACRAWWCVYGACVWVCVRVHGQGVRLHAAAAGSATRRACTSWRRRHRAVNGAAAVCARSIQPAVPVRAPREGGTSRARRRRPPRLHEVSPSPSSPRCRAGGMQIASTRPRRSRLARRRRAARCR